MLFEAVVSQSVRCRRAVAAVAVFVVLALGVLTGLVGLSAVQVDAQGLPTNSELTGSCEAHHCIHWQQSLVTSTEVTGYGTTDLAASGSQATGPKGATVPFEQMLVAARLTQAVSAAAVVAQGENESDPQTTPERRVVETSSSTRIDGVVIGLYAIAGVMTVMLAFFVWHTSPRRRLRLSRQRYKVSGSAQDGVRRAEPGNPGYVEAGDDMV